MMSGKRLFCAIYYLFALMALTGSQEVTNADDVVDEQTNMVGGVQIFEKELACAMLGGNCVQRHDCYPDEFTSVKGLCPKNRKHGVECCYRVKFPKKIQKCEEDFSGACMNRCHQRLRRPADDCASGEHCCVLVN